MANLNVTYEDMRNAATYLQSGRENLESQLMHLREYIANLVSSGFVTDAASHAFDSTYEAFTKSATETISSLEYLAMFLKNAADTLAEADSSLAGSLSGF